MKVDLSTRDIELLLLLLCDSDSMEFGRKINYSAEDLALIEKLKVSLKKSEILEREFMDTSASSDACH